MNQQETESLQKIQINLGSSGFEELVIEAVDQTFTNLGLKVKQVFYYFLENHYKLSKMDIPNRIGDFVEALEKVFGTSALLIEIDVLRSLQQRVPSFTYLQERSELSFESYLASLKHHVENLN